jgi:hypothetical protein
LKRAKREAMSRSSDNVMMLNVIIGLCYNEPNMPSYLYNLGYSDILVERTVDLGTEGKIVPDLILCSSKLRSVVCWESKSGQNIESKQAHKYAKVTPQHINLMHNIAGFDCQIVDTCYLCLLHNSQGIEVDLQREQLSHSLLAIYDRGVMTIINNIKQQNLRTSLPSIIEIDMAKVPVRYRFDADSSFFEVLQYVFQSLVVYAILQGQHPTTEDIAGDAYGELWTVTSANKRKDIVERVRLVLEESMNKGLATYLSKEPPASKSTRSGPKSKWVIRKMTSQKSIQAMQKAYDRMISKMKREPEFPELAKLY